MDNLEHDISFKKILSLHATCTGVLLFEHLCRSRLMYRSLAIKDALKTRMTWFSSRNVYWDSPPTENLAHI